MRINGNPSNLSGISDAAFVNSVRAYFEQAVNPNVLYDFYASSNENLGVAVVKAQQQIRADMAAYGVTDADVLAVTGSTLREIFNEITDVLTAIRNANDLEINPLTGKYEAPSAEDAAREVTEVTHVKTTAHPLNYADDGDNATGLDVPAPSPVPVYTAAPTPTPTTAPASASDVDRLLANVAAYFSNLWADTGITRAYPTAALLIAKINADLAANGVSVEILTRATGMTMAQLAAKVNALYGHATTPAGTSSGGGISAGMLLTALSVGLSLLN